MLAFSHIPMFDRMDHPSVPTTFLGAWGRVAVKDGRKATAWRPPRPWRAPPPHATLATGGHSIPLPLPTIPYRHREAEVGSPSKSATAIPSTIVLLLIQ